MDERAQAIINELENEKKTLTRTVGDYQQTVDVLRQQMAQLQAELQQLKAEEAKDDEPGFDGEDSVSQSSEN